MSGGVARLFPDNRAAEVDDVPFDLGFVVLVLSVLGHTTPLEGVSLGFRFIAWPQLLAVPIPVGMARAA